MGRVQISWHLLVYMYPAICAEVQFKSLSKANAQLKLTRGVVQVDTDTECVHHLSHLLYGHPRHTAKIVLSL